MKRYSFLFTLLFLLTGAISASAGSAEVFKADLMKQVDDMEKKFVDLAQKMPDDKFSWRPAEGVRSVSEVFVHVAGANMMIPRMAGVEPPAGVDRNMEKTKTSKADAVAALKMSFEHLRKAVNQLDEEKLSKQVKLFGRDATVQSVYFLVVNHMHEHLGQAIAYARVNGVTPPWSQG